jgi:hypothetical protein
MRQLTTSALWKSGLGLTFDTHLASGLVPGMPKVRICWLPNRQISVTSNAPYGTGIGIRTSTIKCPSWYCPIFVFVDHCLLFSYQFTLCTFNEP